MKNGFKVMGISTRTTNKNNQSAKDLGKLWEKFYADDISAKIPNKLSNDVISIYTDYKSNYKEDYTAILGFLVPSLNDIPDGLIGREFEPENFKIYTAKGKMPEAVLNTWNQIWNNDQALNRKYTYDFEVYNEKSRREEGAEVDIYIAIN